MQKPTQPTKGKAGRSLTQTVAESLRARIVDGGLRSGDKLPTEAQLTAEFGVSRTVIREAISGLKIDGLVTSRQGAGVFVLDPANSRETIAILSQNPKTIASVIENLELRCAVEIGAAELAAQRCSPAQEAVIYDRFNAFKNKVRAREVSEQEDYDFHVSIAEATNNGRFKDFLSYLGKDTVPRSELRKKANLQVDHETECQILQEHLEILEAIAARNPAEAGAAMRRHLQEGAERYRALARLAQLS